MKTAPSNFPTSMMSTLSPSPNAFRSASAAGSLSSLTPPFASDRLST